MMYLSESLLLFRGFLTMEVFVKVSISMAHINIFSFNNGGYCQHSKSMAHIKSFFI